MTTLSSDLLLYGVFIRLVRANMSLSVSDYLDALRALQLDPSPLLDSAGGQARDPRSKVARLCQILWARTDEEARMIGQIVQEIPAASEEDRNAFERHIVNQHGDAPRSQRPSVPAHAVKRTVDPAATPLVSFAPAERGPGLSWPRLLMRTGGPGPTYVLSPQSVVSARWLSVLWRRFRRFERSGAKSELDIDGTIAERSRRGVIDRPVMRAPRTNRARMLILVDVSPSMAAWRPFIESLARSLSASRLSAPTMLYFDNVPRRAFFDSAQLTTPVSIAEVLQKNAGASVLVLSDGGAARGALNHRRVRETTAFLQLVRRRHKAVVWVNPMPKSRWDGSSAERLARLKDAVFLPLNANSLIQAVDVLRGARTV